MRRIGGVGLAAVLVAAAGLLVRSAAAPAFAGFVFVTGGVAALLLVSFPAREIAGALRGVVSLPATRQAAWRAARVWEAAARSAWVLTALVAIAGFVRILSADPGGPDRFLGAVGEGVAGVAWGMVLAAIFALPALRLSRLAEEAAGDVDPAAAEDPRSPRGGSWERAIGYVLFALLATYPFLAPAAGWNIRPVEWILHVPAWLMVTGGAVALGLYLGGARPGGSLTPGFAVAGAIGAVVGLTEALHGFLTIRIEDVAGGLAFATSCCCAGLVGLAAIGMPFEDRAFLKAAEGKGRDAARWAWYGFPLLALLVLVLTILLVMVPIERRVD